jgi:DNA-directed RNA polymerase subunit M/transcription elongation factor TFIIS
MNPRQTIANIIAAILAGNDKCGQIAIEIEKGCYDQAVAEVNGWGITLDFSDKRFTDRYSAITYKVISNLDPTSSIGSWELYDNIISGAVLPKDVAGMKSEEMTPGSTKVIRNEIEARRCQTIDRKVSRAYYCNICKRNETTFEEYQSRAADESSTKSIKCLVCGNVWRKCD